MEIFIRPGKNPFWDDKTNKYLRGPQSSPKQCLILFHQRHDFSLLSEWKRHFSIGLSIKTDLARQYLPFSKNFQTVSMDQGHFLLKIDQYLQNFVKFVCYFILTSLYFVTNFRYSGKVWFFYYILLYQLFLS